MNIESWNWAQWAVLVLYFVALLIAANEHGKPKSGVNSFWSSAIAVSLILTLLYFGGFWMGKP